jgi:hypothetical protein
VPEVVVDAVVGVVVVGAVVLLVDDVVEEESVVVDELEVGVVDEVLVTLVELDVTELLVVDAVVDVVDAVLVAEDVVLAAVVEVVLALVVDPRAVVDAVGTVATDAVVLGSAPGSTDTRVEDRSAPGRPLPVSDSAGPWGIVSATPASPTEPAGPPWATVPPEPGPQSCMTANPISMAATAPTRTAEDQNQRWAVSPARVSLRRVSWTGMGGTGGGDDGRSATSSERWAGACDAAGIDASASASAGSCTTVDQRRPWGGETSVTGAVASTGAGLRSSGRTDGTVWPLPG